MGGKIIRQLRAAVTHMVRCQSGRLMDVAQSHIVKVIIYFLANAVDRSDRRLLRAGGLGELHILVGENDIALFFINIHVAHHCLHGARISIKFVIREGLADHQGLNVGQ